MFNDDWGAMVELPVTHRNFITADSGVYQTQTQFLDVFNNVTMTHEDGTTFKTASARFDFDDIPAKPIPSLLRGFSAPVRLATDLGGAELAFLAAHDSDPVARWDSGQELAVRTMLANAAQPPHPDAPRRNWTPRRNSYPATSSSN